MQERSSAGKIKLNAGRKKAESRRSHVAPSETETRTLAGKPQSHGEHRLLDMG